MSFPEAGKRPLKNAQFSKPTPDHLRTLVLDYLCHNCYTETARAFARESAARLLDGDGDEVMDCEKGSGDDLTEEMLRLVELRQQIRIHVLSGRIDEATDLLNKHFPLVLSETESYISEPPSPSPIHDKVEYIAPTSVDPTHISLNLRILAFIEASRTVPLEYDPHLQATRSTSPIPAEKLKQRSPIYELDDTDSEAKQTEQLDRAKKLYTAANSLRKPSDRASYLEELGQVGGLLAYKYPEDSPMAKYLSQERREAVANQINSAILHRTGKPAVSNLELYTRYTSVLWDRMHSLGMKPPPLAKRPVPLPPTDRGRTANPRLAKGDTDKEIVEPISMPPFDLRQFLDSKT
jgi:hypothetical protein